MHRIKMIAPLPWLLLFSGTGCALFGGEAPVDLSSLPELSTLDSAPLNTFILDEAGKAHVSRTQPFLGTQGTSSACQHNGAHIHFEDTGSDYEVNIVAPVDGTISYVDPCKLNGDHDKYDIWLAFAKEDGEVVRLMLSIEPMAGTLCSGGNDGEDNGAFSDLIDVEEGDEVSAGDVIGRFTRRAGINPFDDSAHIHYALKIGDTTACPDLFDSDLRSWAYGLFDPEAIPSECRSLGFSETNAFCVNATADESPF